MHLWDTQTRLENASILRDSQVLERRALSIVLKVTEDQHHSARTGEMGYLSSKAYHQSHQALYFPKKETGPRYHK